MTVMWGVFVVVVFFTTNILWEIEILIYSFPIKTWQSILLFCIHLGFIEYLVPIMVTVLGMYSFWIFNLLCLLVCLFVFVFILTMVWKKLPFYKADKYVKARGTKGPASHGRYLNAMCLSFWDLREDERSKMELKQLVAHPYIEVTVQEIFWLTSAKKWEIFRGASIIYVFAFLFLCQIKRKHILPLEMLHKNGKTKIKSLLQPW